MKTAEQLRTEIAAAKKVFREIETAMHAKSEEIYEMSLQLQELKRLGIKRGSMVKTNSEVDPEMFGVTGTVLSRNNTQVVVDFGIHGIDPFEMSSLYLAPTDREWLERLDELAA